MKKRYLLVLGLLPLTILTSCGDNSTTSSSEEVIDKSDVVNYNIKTLSKGVLLNGEVTQTRQTATNADDDGNYVWSSTKETNSYSTTIGYSSKDRNAIYKHSVQEYEGEEQSIENYTYFEDEKGYAYSESLNYKNELERDYSINLTTSSFASNGFYNPFSILQSSDITKDFNGSYILDTNKAEIITNNLLYSLNSGFGGSVKEAFFSVGDDGLFNRLIITMNSYIYYDSSYGYIYKVENTVDFTISNGGTYLVSSEQTYSNKGYTSLTNGLKNLGNNYTLSVEMYSKDQVSGSATTTYQDFYFTGSEIYVHSYDDTANKAVDKTTDFYLKADEDGTLYSYVYNSETSDWGKGATTAFPSLYQGKNTYNDYLPSAYEVSSDLFKYDETNKKYVAEDNAASALTSCFYPNVAPFRTSASNSFYDVEINLDGDKISSVKLPFSYTSYTTASINTGTFTLTYSNIGTTVNPK